MVVVVVLYCGNPQNACCSVSHEQRHFSGSWRNWSSPSFDKIQAVDQKLQMQQCKASGYSNNKKTKAATKTISEWRWRKNQLESHQGFPTRDVNYYPPAAAEPPWRGLHFLGPPWRGPTTWKKAPAQTGAKGVTKAPHQEPSKATISQIRQQQH